MKEWNKPVVDELTVKETQRSVKIDGAPSGFSGSGSGDESGSGHGGNQRPPYRPGNRH